MQSTSNNGAKITQIQDSIGALSNKIQSLKTRYDQIIDAKDDDQESNALNELQKDDSEICRELEDLKHGIQECKQYSHFEMIAEALPRRLGTIMGNYQAGRREYEKRRELRDRRRYKITGVEVPTPHLEVENGPIFANHILKIDKHSQSAHALSNITNRHNGIRGLEASFRTLAEIFQQTNELVEQHEEPIKVSELKSEQTAGQVEKGNTATTKAIEHTRSRISKRRWAWFISAAIIIALAVAVVTYIKTRN